MNKNLKTFTAFFVLLFLFSFFFLSSRFFNQVHAQSGGLPGDANGDGRVDGIDYVIWFNNYGQVTNNGAADGDFNADTEVDGIDYVIWFNNYGSTASPTPTGPVPTIPPATGDGIWVDKNKLLTLPTSGSPWSAVYNTASGSLGTANVSDQDSKHDTNTLAAALVCARTQEFCSKARQALVSAIDTEEGARWLAIGRNMTSYIIAADVLNLKSDGNPSSDGSRVQAWIARFLTRTLKHNNSGEQVMFPVFKSGSNASAQQGAVYAAAAAYLGDSAPTIQHPWTGQTISGKQHLDRVWNAFRRYACDPGAPDDESMNLKDTSWQYDANNKCAVNIPGASKQDQNGVTRRLDGAIPNDMRRGGEFVWPPGYTSYPWVGLEGFVPAALILHRAGYPAFEVASQAVLRTHEFLWYVRTTTGNTDWFDSSRADEVKHLVNVVYGKDYGISSGTGGGRTVGYTDWTHPDGI